VVILISLFFLNIAGCTIGREPKHPNWKNATGAEQYERLMWQDIRKKDWQDVEYHLAPTFVGVNAQGRALDREGWVEYWKSADIKEVSLGEFSVQPSGTHMVVTFVLHLVGTAAGRPFPQDGLRVISVWQQVKSGWILTATSCVPVTSDESASHGTL
jgi:hypothetical protein